MDCLVEIKRVVNHVSPHRAGFHLGSACGQPILRRAMTLVELLVVIAIIGTLMGLLIPAVRAARASSKGVTCKNNLRQIGIGLEEHLGHLGRYPVDGKNGYGACAFLLPYVEQQALYAQLKPTESERPAIASNASLGGTAIATFLCPTMESRRQTVLKLGRASYLGNRDLFPWNLPQTVIRDSKSETIAMGETLAEQAWILPGTAEAIPPGDDSTFGSRHPGGANFVFCDASVRFISENIDPVTFLALCTTNGGEPTVER